MQMKRFFSLCRQEIVVRGVAYVHAVPQRSIQQLDSSASTAMSVVSAAPSLDDVDLVMANLEGLCTEETSWKSQETNLEQCIQVGCLTGAAVGVDDHLIALLLRAGALS